MNSLLGKLVADGDIDPAHTVIQLRGGDWDRVLSRYSVGDPLIVPASMRPAGAPSGCVGWIDGIPVVVFDESDTTADEFDAMWEAAE